MALMTPQTLDSLLTPSFTAPTTSDTIQYQPGLYLHVRYGATSTNTSVVVPGVEPYSGGPKDDLTATGVTNSDRIFRISELAADPATGIVTVTHSQVTNVTAALIKHTT